MLWQEWLYKTPPTLANRMLLPQRATALWGAASVCPPACPSVCVSAWVSVLLCCRYCVGAFGAFICPPATASSCSSWQHSAASSCRKRIPSVRSTDVTLLSHTPAAEERSGGGIHASDGMKNWASTCLLPLCSDVRTCCRPSLVRSFFLKLYFDFCLVVGENLMINSQIWSMIEMALALSHPPPSLCDHFALPSSQMRHKQFWRHLKMSHQDS